jgi:DNA-binding transcriptional MerR regulator/methylmalonyl-CoA mutase cobalamin-binding subunit
MNRPDEVTIPRHPIGVVAERTRLSQDVLRVWERRYRVVEPGRSPTGQRLYSDADIERLRLLSLATQSGRTISHVASLDTEDLARMVREDEEARGAARDAAQETEPVTDVIGPAMERILALDPTGLDSLLRRALLSVGMSAFVDSIAAPLLTMIGDEWHAGRLTPAHEHLASAIVHRVVTAAIHAVPAGAGAPNFVLATPAGERHEIGAVLAAATASADGWRITYLGADLPANDIADAAIRANAQAVGLSVIYAADRSHVLHEIRTVRGRLPASMPLLIGGGASAALSAELARDGIRFVNDLAELRNALRAIAAPALA